MLRCCQSIHVLHLEADSQDSENLLWIGSGWSAFGIKEWYVGPRPLLSHFHAFQWKCSTGSKSSETSTGRLEGGDQQLCAAVLQGLVCFCLCWKEEDGPWSPPDSAVTCIARYFQHHGRTWAQCHFRKKLLQGFCGCFRSFAKLHHENLLKLGRFSTVSGRHAPFGLWPAHAMCSSA